MKYFKIYIFIAILLLCSSAYAATGVHIKNATLSIRTNSGKTYTCTTDANGKFTLPVMDEDCDDFTISMNYEKISWSWGQTNSGGKVSLIRESPTKSSVGATSSKIVSPRDAASGLPTGKRMHKPFTYKATLCPNGDCAAGEVVLELKSDGSTIQGMAINTKGTPGSSKPSSSK